MPGSRPRSAAGQWYARLSPEKKAAYIEKVKERQRNLPPEKKAEYQARHRARQAAMPEDAKQALRDARRAAYAAAKQALREQEKPPAPGSRVAKAREQAARAAEYRRQQKRDLREMVAKIKTERGCAKCYDRNPAVLHFHHKDPAAKIADINTMISNRSRPALLAEIQKCVVLCAVCHAREHQLLSVL